MAHSRIHGPHGDAEKDPDYDGKSARPASTISSIEFRSTSATRAIVAVRVTLNYQSIPPYYLKQRFTIGQGQETQRLAYLTSHLTLEGSPVEGWKLPLVCTGRRLASTNNTEDDRSLCGKR
jgi:hypothetical protein